MAGARHDPPVSSHSAQGANLAATEAADPALLPAQPKLRFTNLAATEAADPALLPTESEINKLGRYASS